MITAEAFAEQYGVPLPTATEYLDAMRDYEADPASAAKWRRADRALKKFEREARKRR